MRKNKRLITIVTALVLLGLVLCGTVISYMFHISEQKDNLFTPAEVSCEVLESFNGEEKSSIAVENTSNIAAYLRLRLVSYWENGQRECDFDMLIQIADIFEVSVDYLLGRTDY